jgi:hypothetical protein
MEVNELSGSIRDGSLAFALGRKGRGVRRHRGSVLLRARLWRVHPAGTSCAGPTGRLRLSDAAVAPLPAHGGRRRWKRQERMSYARLTAESVTA